jgi:hypothetical protein
MADDDEPVQEEKKLAFEKIGNLEDAKRAFCNKEYENCLSLLRQKPFKFMTAEYKFADEFDGKPNFIIVNRNRGFSQALDKFRPYFFIAFRCEKNAEGQTQFKSFWIINTPINTPVDLQTVIPDDYENFTFTESTLEEVCAGFQNDDCLHLEYLH